MADSIITVTSLTATSAPGAVLLAFATSGGGPGCLSYLALATVEIWSATTNNRGSAVKVGEGVGTFLHAGLSGTGTRYYWARAKDASGNFGDFFPASATGGRSAAPGRQLGTGQVTNDDLAGDIDGSTKIRNASIGNAQIDNMSASKLTAGTVTVTVTFTAPNINGGVISGGRFEVGSISLSQPSISMGATVGSGVSSVFLNQFGNSGESVVRATNLGNGSTCHGGRFRNAPLTGAAGGSGIIGVPAVGGGHAFYAEAGGFAPFTGAHEALIAKADAAAIGDIVCSTGRVFVRKDMSTILTEVRRADAPAMKAVFGIVVRRQPFDAGMIMASFIESHHTACNFLRRYAAERFDHVVVNALGDGQLAVCGLNGPIEVGDLICSSALPGKGMRQDDDLVRSSTVAKALEPATFDTPDQVKLIACTYHCG